MLEKGIVPKQTFSVTDIVALIVGVVIGIGIFKTPSMVAANTGRADVFFLAWVAGGVVSLIGALCYAELAMAYPHTGGDYHYLTRAFGRKVGFLFVWSRMTVIQPGSIAMLAFVFGDYLSQILPLGHSAYSIYAALSIAILTALNIPAEVAGVWRWSVPTQKGDSPYTLQLKQNFQEVKGHVMIQGGRRVRIKEAKLTGDRLNFAVKYNEANKQKVVMQFNGRVSRDTILGNVEVTGGPFSGEYTWTARRNP